MSAPSRRAVLRGLLAGAAVSVGLPLLPSLSRSARASDELFPRRFGMFTWGNGMIPDLWIPEGTGADWIPSTQLSPLVGLKPKLTVVTGMEVRVPNIIPHFSGQYGFTSGMEPIGEEGSHTPAGPTVDQLIAARTGNETVYRSLETGANPGDGTSYLGPWSPLPHESDPHAFFERVFGAGFRAPGETLRVDPKIALRRSVLDAVTGQAAQLEARLGAADRQRLDQHLTGIRELELRLARMEADPPNLAACVRPGALDMGLSFADLAVRHRAVTDLLVLALACDQTRVFNHTFTGAVNNHQYPGISEGHHKLTHDEPGEQEQVQAIVLQIMAELDYFLRALDAVPEGDGTLLDHMVVLCTSDVSLGRTHGLDEFPIVLAGSASGRLRTGLHYRSTTRENAGKVILSLVRAMDIAMESWGTGDVATRDGLSEIEA